MTVIELACALIPPIYICYLIPTIEETDEVHTQIKTPSERGSPMSKVLESDSTEEPYDDY